MIDPMGEIRRDKGSGEKPQWMAARGRWRARYTDANGKRRAVFSYIPGRKGERECAKRRDEKVAAVQAGVDLGRSAMKVEDYLARWLRVAGADLRPRSRQKYEGSVRLHIVPFIGGTPLSKLRTPRINDLYAELTAAGRSPDTVRYTHSVLHSALTFAVQEHTLTANPADHAKIPRKGKTNIHPFTPAETTELLAGIVEDPLEVLIILALRTAMRLGELLGLRWSDVDPAGNLQVLRELYRFEGEWLTDDPKSGKTRAISVEADTVEMLRAYRIERSEALLSIGHRVTDDDPIFLTDEGQPFDGHHLTERRFQPLLKRLGLLGSPRKRFHDLRHTAATLMLAGGIHPKVVSEMLGHADVQITLNRYSHVLPTMQAEAAAALEALTVRAAR